MKKTVLQNFLAKYNLNGLVEETIWTIKDGKLLIKFRAEDTTVMGIGLLNEFDLEDGEFGVYNTSTMMNAINPLDEDINIELIKDEEGGFIRINYIDIDVKNQRVLSDVGIIENTFKSATFNDDIFDVKMKIDENFLTKFNKIKNVTSDNIAIRINDDKTATFIINYSENNVDTGHFDIEIEEGDKTEPIIFKLDALAKILNNNKKTNGSIRLSTSEGLLEFKFKDNDMKFVYYTVALQQ